MRYCASCQVLVPDGDECPSCGSRKLREVRENDPVLLLTAGEMDCGRITAAFDDAGISHEERMCGAGAPPSILYGKSPNSLYRIFVPYGAVESSRRILKDIGILDKLAGETEKNKKDKPDPLEKSVEQMSPAQRTAVRIGSAVLFILLIWAVVAASDKLVDVFRHLFS